MTGGRQVEKVLALSKVPLFSELDDEHLAEIAKHSDLVPVKSGKIFTEQGKMGLIAAILLFIGGFVGLAYGAYMLYIITLVGVVSGGLFFAAGGGIFYLCAILPLLGGILGILGGVFSMKRQKWAICLIASIFVMIGAFFIIGLIALIVLVIGKKEFVS